MSVNAKSTFKIIHFGGHVFRIEFFKSLKKRRQKMQKKVYSKLIRCLKTYFSIKILSIYQFLFRHCIEFLILCEFVHRFP